MLKYIIKRIILFAPTLLIISLLAFVISINAPGDPVERLTTSANKEGTANEQSSSTKKTKEEIRTRLGLDLPVFYFSLSTLSDCDTLYKIADKAQQENLLKLTRKYGNWNAVSTYYHATLELQKEYNSLDVEQIFSKNTTYSKNEINDAKNNTSFAILSLLETFDENNINAKLDSLESAYKKYTFLTNLMPKFEKVKTSFEYLKQHSTSWKTYIPKIIFYGNNQYHHWLFGNAPWFTEAKAGERKGVLRGDFGISYIDNQPVSDKIWKCFWISFRFIFISVILAYVISIPIGIYAAYKKDSKFDRISSVTLFALYSMPSFFIGTLLLYAFANPDVLVWFPEAGIRNPAIFNENWPWYQRWAHEFPYMVLPLITYTYGSFAFLSRIMRVGMIDVMGQDFIRTARAKGLSEKTVVIKHAFRNSLLPIITVFANIFPIAIGGSVIIEVIFSLPGMGLETYDAILNYDYPMIVAIFTISGFLTVIGYLIADILYAIVDPRISFN